MSIVSQHKIGCEERGRLKSFSFELFEFDLSSFSSWKSSQQLCVRLDLLNCIKIHSFQLFMISLLILLLSRDKFVQIHFNLNSIVNVNKALKSHLMTLIFVYIPSLCSSSYTILNSLCRALRENQICIHMTNSEWFSGGWGFSPSTRFFFSSSSFWCNLFHFLMTASVHTVKKRKQLRFKNDPCEEIKKVFLLRFVTRLRLSSFFCCHLIWINFPTSYSSILPSSSEGKISLFSCAI